MRILAFIAFGFITHAACAADLPVFDPPPDFGDAPLINPTPIAYNWSGFSAAAFAGAAWAELHADQLYNDLEDINLNTPSAPFGFDEKGFTGGVEVSFDRQWRAFVFGVAGELGVLQLDASLADPTVLPTPIAGSEPDTSFSSDFYGAVTGRVGVAFNRLLLYAKGGVAFLDAEASTVDDCGRAFCGIITVDASGEDLLLGWTAGAGVELALSDHWSLGGEYRFFDFEDLEVSGVGSNLLTYSQNIDVESIHTVRGYARYRW